MPLTPLKTLLFLHVKYFYLTNRSGELGLLVKKYGKPERRTVRQFVRNSYNCKEQFQENGIVKLHLADWISAQFSGSFLNEKRAELRKNYKNLEIVAFFAPKLLIYDFN